jgi:hypothetical protein
MMTSSGIPIPNILSTSLMCVQMRGCHTKIVKNNRGFADGCQACKGGGLIGLT